MSNSKRPHAPKEEKRGAQEIQLSHLDNRFSCQIDGTVIPDQRGAVQPGLQVQQR